MDQGRISQSNQNIFEIYVSTNQSIFQSLDDEIMPWDIETGKQIIAEKTGLNFSPSDDSRITDIENTGLIWEPRQNTLEEEAYLTEMYQNLDRTLPNSYDSRSLGIITPIRNQKKRATCVAFATGVALETGLKKAVKGAAKLSKIDVSEQQLLDCGYVQGGSTGGI